MIEIFYLNYLYLFFFDNIISHLAFIKNTLQVKDIKKNIGGQ